MVKATEIKRSFLIALWFMFLTFPILVIRVNTINRTVNWRWQNMIAIGVAVFFGSFVWRFALERKQRRAQTKRTPTVNAAGVVASDSTSTLVQSLRNSWERAAVRRSIIAAAALALVVLPWVGSLYQVSVVNTALIYVILALGLNVVIGLGGMLHLGYAAFFAVGAYTYGILFRFFGVGFWVALPIGALVSTLFGVLLAIPVLRLRGDYLAIVTLGFAEIMRIVLNNAGPLSGGPQGIGGIPRPALFGLRLGLSQATIYIYYIILLAVILAVFVMNRIENSRLGRALLAMGEDDIAAEAMGVDTTKAKVTAFAIGSFWAGLAGVIFAARTTFINPTSFSVWQSIMVLSCVVLGGMGSIPGAILGALVLIMVPEYLRAFADYRMLLFGVVLVVMMVFRPGGLIQKQRRAYVFSGEQSAEEAEA